jgi:hypothetical protein
VRNRPAVAAHKLVRSLINPPLFLDQPLKRLTYPSELLPPVGPEHLRHVQRLGKALLAITQRGF